MNATNIKLGVGLLCFGVWLALVVFKVDGADDIISAIKITLAGLGVYHMNDKDKTP